MKSKRPSMELNIPKNNSSKNLIFDKDKTGSVEQNVPWNINSSLVQNDLTGAMYNPAFDMSPESDPTSDKQVVRSRATSLPNLIADIVSPYQNDDLELQKIKAEGKEHTLFIKYRGLILAFTASFFFSLVILFVKILKDYGFDPCWASVWRYVGTTFPTIPLFIYFECGPDTNRKKSVFHNLCPVQRNWKPWMILMTMGVVGTTSVLLRYSALQYLTIGDTQVIADATPIFVTLLAHCFLGERCGIFPAIITLVTLCGVVIVAKPPLITGASEFDTGSLIGTGLACGSLFCSTVVVITTRKLREVHFTVMMLVIGVSGMGEALAITYWLEDFNLPVGLIDSLLVVGVATFSFLAQLSWTLALKFEDAGPVSLIRCCDVIFGFIFQYAFLSVVPDMFSAIGGTIVLAGVLLTGLRKWLSSLP